MSLKFATINLQFCERYLILFQSLLYHCNCLQFSVLIFALTELSNCNTFNKGCSKKKYFKLLLLLEIKLYCYVLCVLVCKRSLSVQTSQSVFQTKMNTLRLNKLQN